MSSGLPPIRLVIGDEELLVNRAVSEVVTAARNADPGADIREFEASQLSAGELAETVSPSLFGGRRVTVIRNGQDAKKDLITALLSYAKNPADDVTLVITHAGGARGKALTDGLRAAKVDIVTAAPRADASGPPPLGGTSAVLVRPDGYVAWAAPGSHRDLPTALDRWFGPGRHATRER